MAVVIVTAKPCSICGGTGIYRERLGADVYEEGECDCTVSPEFQGNVYAYRQWTMTEELYFAEDDAF
jgi:hypothetical protein